MTTKTFSAPALVMHILQELCDDQSVMGVVVVGSASCQTNDAFSDWDLQIVLEDSAFDSLSTEQLIAIREFDSVRIELHRTSWRDFQSLRSSPRDYDHWGYRSARILLDRDGCVSAEVEKIRAFPKALQVERVRLHLFEFYFYANRMEALLQRGDRVSLALTYGEIAETATVLAMVARGQWPPLLHWSGQELLAAGAQLVRTRLEGLVAGPSLKNLEALKIALLEDLCAHGFSNLVEDPYSLARVTAPSHRKIREVFGRL